MRLKKERDSVSICNIFSVTEDIFRSIIKGNSLTFDEKILQLSNLSGYSQKPINLVIEIRRVKTSNKIHPALILNTLTTSITISYLLNL